MTDQPAVFEMLWNCSYCGTTALHGKTDRHCPQCGAPQDATKRYFPPPGQEVAVNTSFDGADRICPSCQQPMGAKAQCCRNCGTPLTGAAEAKRQADRVEAPPIPPTRHRRRVWIGVLLLLATCGTVGVLSFTVKRSTTVEVSGHKWTRTIGVEQLAAVSDSAWCDALPAGAYQVTRVREQRATRKIPDGETCTDHDVDRGDGTFERKHDCHPKYRDEPVMDDKCHFTLDCWRHARDATAAGGLNDAPQWPEVKLDHPGNTLGSEREGERSEAYTVQLTRDDGKASERAEPEPTWRALADGARPEVKVYLATGGIDCASLQKR